MTTFIRNTKIVPCVKNACGPAVRTLLAWRKMREQDPFHAPTGMRIEPLPVKTRFRAQARSIRQERTAMTSEERRIGRRKRREEARALKKAAYSFPYDDFDNVFTFRHMYLAYRKTRKGVMWKNGMQRYSMIAGLNIQRTLRRLREGRWRSSGFYDFSIHERGKLRHIQAVDNEERNLQRCLCDYCMVPLFERGFIDGNAATRKGKGYHYAIRLVRKSLTKHIRRYGTSGYVLLFDFKNFFQSINHEVVKRIVDKTVHDPRLVQLIQYLIDCFGEVGLGLGSQISQMLSLAVGDRIDHAVTELCGMKGCVRYMDDGFLLSPSKKKLRECMKVLYALADELKLTLHRNKTRIIRLSHGFTFLKKRFSFTDTGKIIMKICRKSVQTERRKLKKLVRKVHEGKMSWQDVYQSFQSWRSYASHGNAHRTIRSMEAYYTKLVFGSCTVP